MTRMLRRARKQHPSLRVAALVVLAAVCLCSSQAQSGGSKAAPPPSDSSASKPGFAIESEMMTYSAMDAAAHELACGIARNLGAADERCTPRGMSGPAGGVVVVSEPSSALSQFQLWRTDISTMTMLTLRANPYCARNAERGASSKSSLGSTILSMIPGGQALSFAQALLSSTSESAPLQGNIIDQTLVNDVAGHLRALGVFIVIPDTYMPGSLTALDERHSPFMTKFLALMKARACVESAGKEKHADQGSESGEANKESGGQDEAEKQSIAVAIDVFLKSLNQAEVASSATSAGASPASPQPTISHLSAVLRADGLAQELGATSSDSRSGENGAWYLLSLKALESGGTVHKSGNAILGSKTTYAGGSVGTYALFRLTGGVVCSGAFYNYSTPLQDSKIPKMLASSQTMQGGKVVGGRAATQ